MNSQSSHARATVVALLVGDLERQRFYRTLEVKFEAGRAVLVRKGETIKLNHEDYRDNRGQTNGSKSRQTDQG